MRQSEVEPAEVDHHVEVDLPFEEVGQLVVDLDE